MENANNFYQSPQSQLNAVSGQEAVDPKFISFSGRLDQFRYAVFGLLYIVIGMMSLAPFVFYLGLDPYTWDFNAAGTIAAIVMMVLVVIIFLALCFGLYIRRFHDIGRSGWNAVIMLIPIVSSVLNIYLMLKKGDEHENNWGAQIMEASSAMKRFGCIVIGLSVVLFVLDIIANAMDLFERFIA
ncbi:DUF805 domain-containing protein [Algicola sagamiensis]|uniref:DUF805 domain-containing protein n=1 Tax=Algicola sagamiensis TaxID=163869 RepID=UPI00037F2BC2|nr:DUF805 domain-containing protein [Algicola sagamiensis]